MTRGVGLSMFTLLFEQWEGVINTDEHSHLTQASMNQIYLSLTHTHTQIEITPKIPRKSHDPFHQLFCDTDIASLRFAFF